MNAGLGLELEVDSMGQYVVMNLSSEGPAAKDGRIKKGALKLVSSCVSTVYICQVIGLWFAILPPQRPLETHFTIIPRTCSVIHATLLQPPFHSEPCRTWVSTCD